jgi:hypothetical protein
MRFLNVARAARIDPMQTVRTAIFSLIACSGVAAVAQAQVNPVPDAGGDQGTRYNVQEMNFDMWCQEEQHLPAARCDKRLPEDDAAFDTYRAKVERYEIPYLQEQRKELQLNTGILHNDPVDHPDQPSAPQNQPISSQPPPG